METKISKPECNKIIAEFMGYQKVRIGYFDDSSETKWQRDNSNWMDAVDLNEVGTYIVNVKKNKYFKWADVAYTKSWDWLMPAWFYFQKKLKSMHYHGPSADLSYIQETFIVGISHDQNIDTCVHALVEGIKWYKTNNKRLHKNMKDGK